HLRRMTLGATDQERQIAALRAPVLEPRRKLLRGPRLAAPIQRDHPGVARQRCQHARAFVGGRAHGVAVLAAKARRDLDQLKRQPVRQPLLVLRVTLGHPGWCAFAYGDQPRLHAAWSSPYSLACSGGWSPTVHSRSSA